MTGTASGFPDSALWVWQLSGQDPPLVILRRNYCLSPAGNLTADVPGFMGENLKKMRGNYREFLNPAGREDEIREPAACAGLLFVTARSFSRVFFWFFYETLPYPLQKSSTVNLHSRVLCVFFAFFGLWFIVDEKKPVFTRLGKLGITCGKPIRAENQPSSDAGILLKSLWRYPDFRLA